jgi:hypothetical protein
MKPLRRAAPISDAQNEWQIRQHLRAYANGDPVLVENFGVNHPNIEQAPGQPGRPASILLQHRLYRRADRRSVGQKTSGDSEQMILDHEERLGPLYYYRQHGELEVCVVPLLLGRARITIGPVGSLGWFEGY